MDKQEQLYEEFVEKQRHLESQKEKLQKDIHQIQALREQEQQAQHQLQVCLRQMIDENEQNAFYNQLEEYVDRIRVCAVSAGEGFDENIRELKKEAQKIRTEMDKNESDYKIRCIY